MVSRLARVPRLERVDGLERRDDERLGERRGQGREHADDDAIGRPRLFRRTSGRRFERRGQSYGAGLFCFPAGTKIKMADGTEKRIEYIEVGDKVMAWGENGEEEAEVLRTMQPHHVEVYNLVCSDAHTMATLSQPFLTEDGAWVTLEDLKMKQRLKNAGEVHAVSFSGDRRVYDLQVSGENTYIADYALGKTNTMPAFGVGGAQPTQEQAAAMEAVAAQAASQAGAPQMGVPQAQAGAPQTLGVPGLAKPASELSSEELMQLLTGQPNFKADPFGLRGADGGVKNTASVPNWITAESIYKYLQSIGQIDKKVVSRAAPDT